MGNHGSAKRQDETTVDAAFCQPVMVNTLGQAWGRPAERRRSENLAGSITVMKFPRREVVASRGIDIEALDAELAADKSSGDVLGLIFPARPPANR